MRTYRWGIMILVGMTLATGQASAGDADYFASVTAASRELSRQLDFLQRSFATIPGPPEGRGLYQQSDKILLDLGYFRLRLKDKAGRDELYLAFENFDGKITTLLSDLQGFEPRVPAVRLGARRVKSAQHDLQFALSVGDDAPARQTQVTYRQTLVMLTRVEDLDSMVRYVFTEQDTINRWVAALKEMRGAVNDLQTLQQKKAARADVKAQVEQMELVWGKLVTMFKELPENQYFLLQADGVQVDGVLDRFDKAFDLKGRARLPNNSLFQ